MIRKLMDLCKECLIAYSAVQQEYYIKHVIEIDGRKITHELLDSIVEKVNESKGGNEEIRVIAIWEN